MDKEMRLIEADKAKFFIADVLDIFKVPVGDRMANRLLEVIDALPTVDAVPVVRCKDCKSYMAETQERCNALKANPFGWCLRHRKLNEVDYREIRNAGDFCSCGERKDDGC